MPIMATEKHAWWSDLRHNGMLVAPALLDEYFPAGPVEPSQYRYQRLRERYTIFDTWWRKEGYAREGSHQPLYDWLDGVLDIFLGHEGKRWQKGNHVSATWKHTTFQGSTLAPSRVLFLDMYKQETAQLFVWVEQTRQIGMGQGRTAYGKLLELLRAKNVKLGLLTNGRQFRLCYAGQDYDSWVEWDADAWFAEGELRRQLYGFYTLLGSAGMQPTASSKDGRFPLLDAAEASRSRQGELSTVLGEQVREAVELLLNELNRAAQEHGDILKDVRLAPSGEELPQRRLLEALYQAAVRIIMRLVIIFFAEARDLLPRSLPMYHDAYGLEGLYEQLNRAVQYEGRKTLEERESAWARLLSLFHVIYNGSAISILPVQTYGGLLFRPGDLTSSDAILRAVALFESLEHLSIMDSTVLRLLELLKRGKVRIKQGRTSRLVPGPVDFSELRTEYIGLMYQGLLDFHLHMADQPMIFLNLGQEPVLPLNVLEQMPNQQRKDLLKKLSAERSSGPAVSDEEDEGKNEEQDVTDETFPDETVAEDEEVLEDEAGSVLENAIVEDEDTLYARAMTWAEQTVEIVGMVKKPRGKQKGGDSPYQQERVKAAKKLIKRTLNVNEFYLIRRGGTRKGSGTFYTRPQLSVPIAWRTLEPLAYMDGEDGKRIPRRPEEILSVKVCDPACGSASFLVAALHYLTNALYDSLVYYYQIDELPEPEQGRIIRTMPYGKPSRALVHEELLPITPKYTNFETRTKASLRRHIVEHCIYGVDLSPLAVELARMSLWIETLDYKLPFTFLDHKIKVGNALVGTWFDTFREYPIMAWMREGGDTGHRNGVHYKQEEWTRAIKEERNEVIKPALIRQIESSGQQLLLFEEDRQVTPENLYSEITFEMEQIHLLPVESADEREERYQELQQRSGYQELKLAFDCWCAIWFWPADKLGEVPTPANLYQLPTETRQQVKQLAEEHHFFHWELEFPDVFARDGHGFDAILANPPWDIITRAQSLEFFTNYDPLYRTYGRQEALNAQKRLFLDNSVIEREWLLYQAYSKCITNWAKYAGSPFGDPEIDATNSFSLKTGRKGNLLHHQWRQRRKIVSGYSDRNHPFRYQVVVALNTYKMFLELSHHILKQKGQLGTLVPSGIYTDQGSKALRVLFLDKCDWKWLFGFINWQRIFDIDSRFKFVVVLLEKGGKTQSLKVVFNRANIADLEQTTVLELEFPRKQIEQFSPKSLIIVEPQTERDLNVLEKLYANAVLLDDQNEQSWQLQYSRELNMTDDSALFPPLPRWLNDGYRSDNYGRWLDSKGNIALPLYEGRMIGAFDPSEKGWVSGKGRTAVWRKIPMDKKIIEPQYLLSQETYTGRVGVSKGNKISFMRVSSATNTRSMYATFVHNIPCVYTAPTLLPAKNDALAVLFVVSCLNSFAYDYMLRCRFGGLDLSYFVIAETPLIPPVRIQPTICAQLAARLNFIVPSFAPQWLEVRQAYPQLGQQHWRQLWAITSHERLRLRCMLDAIIAELYGLDYDDFAWILRDDLTNPKGFWRVDKEKPKELRHTTLALAAFARLKEVGLDAFQLEDWQFPPEVATQLGPRFTSWQKEGTVEESWQECEMHAHKVKELLPMPPAYEVSTEAETGNHKMSKTNGKQNSRTMWADDRPQQLSMLEPDHQQLSFFDIQEE
ncbi:hypothetical protein KDH_66410 [Dictyobacter sp. S3.2.2.5]|uniref:site-specific DNA-methyltransferase (adenine-specific) n=1 Tax=Dictyobacter halimunensis TaxID=3026934 RepID=A0ABQ6G598_9CHLR|nr:hypothetical protein KDH_66410 [Dictyobacter sp. S3.2.2.5]